MATATARKIDETYRCDRDLSQAGIRYFVDKAGFHVVVHEKPAGEDIGPSVYRHKTIDAARLTYVQVRAWILAHGYVKVS